jgi:transposase-like protein
VFGDTKLPLETWFMAVRLLVGARKGMSANQLKRTIGVSYKTAWVERGGKRGRGTEKEIVLGIRQRGGELRFFHVEDVKSGTLAKYVQEHVSGNVEVIVTDDSSSYPKALDDAAPPLFGNMRSKHKTIKHSAGEYVSGDIHTNTIESAFSLLKRGIVGSWHKVSAKHLTRYLAEMEFRFNRRKHRDLFTETLRHMVNTDPLQFSKLVS